MTVHGTVCCFASVPVFVCVMQPWKLWAAGRCAVWLPLQPHSPLFRHMHGATKCPMQLPRLRSLTRVSQLDVAIHGFNGVTAAAPALLRLFCRCNFFPIHHGIWKSYVDVSPLLSLFSRTGCWIGQSFSGYWIDVGHWIDRSVIGLIVQFGRRRFKSGSHGPESGHN